MVGLSLARENPIGKRTGPASHRRGSGQPFSTFTDAGFGNSRSFQSVFFRFWKHFKRFLEPVFQKKICIHFVSFFFPVSVSEIFWIFKTYSRFWKNVLKFEKMFRDLKNVSEVEKCSRIWFFWEYRKLFCNLIKCSGIWKNFLKLKQCSKF